MCNPNPNRTFRSPSTDGRQPQRPDRTRIFGPDVQSLNTQISTPDFGSYGHLYFFPPPGSTLGTKVDLCPHSSFLGALTRSFPLRTMTTLPVRRRSPSHHQSLESPGLDSTHFPLPPCPSLTRGLPNQWSTQLDDDDGIASGCLTHRICLLHLRSGKISDLQVVVPRSS